MEKLRDFKNIILWGGLDKEQFRIIKPDIIRKNRIALQIFSFFSIIVFAGLAYLSYVDDVYEMNRTLYFALLGVSVLIFVASRLLATKSAVLTVVLCYLFLAMYIALSVVATFTDIDQKATIIVAAFISTPMLFILRPINMIAFEVSAEIIYLILISQFQKGYYVYTINLFNSFVFCIVGLFVGVSVIYEKAHNVYNANRNTYLLEIDEMTGLYNRRSFERDYAEIQKENPPQSIIVFDVNGLKNINDNIGHDAGDELICGAADCIRKSFGDYGKCYRVGGDEFIAFLDKSFEENELLRSFESAMENWHGQLNHGMAISYGIAKSKENPGKGVQELLKIADSRMYKNKADYYIKSNLDRRVSQ